MFQAARRHASSALAQLLWADPSGLIPAAPGTTNSSGDYAVTFRIPATPGLGYRAVWLQGARLGTRTVELSPIVGGMIR